MRLHDAIHNFKYIRRSGWCGEFVDCASKNLDIHQLPGFDRPLSVEDTLAQDWEEFFMPDVGEGVVI